MSQFNWTYLAPSGGRHNVGIFHGKNTGHVLIYVNAKVVTVDFKVLESKSYSLFIEDELCEISIEKQTGNRYTYCFHIDKEADTPLNQFRKKEESKHLKQSMMFLGGLIVLVLAVIFGISQFTKDDSPKTLAQLLAANGKTTSAKVYLSGEDEATYNFVANGKAYSDKTQFEDQGMPLEDGDEFIIKYSSNRPRLHEINFNRPTKDQILVYKQRAWKKYMELHPNQNEAYCKCLTDVAYELEGINGLAKFYLQDNSPEKNPKYNSDAFHRLVRDLPFQKKSEKDCWRLK